MKPRRLALSIAPGLGLCLALGVWAADTGPRPHARGPFDPSTGAYKVVGGDDLGPIAERFGLTLGQLEQLNGLAGSTISVGQRLSVTEELPSVQQEYAPPPAQAAASAQPQGASAPPDPWPRQVQAGGQTMLVYQPQPVSWQANLLKLRAAVAVKPAAGGTETFGTVQAEARTQVDRVQRMVVLDEIKLTQTDFPAQPGLAATLGDSLSAGLAGAIRIVPLDRLETALAIAQAGSPAGIAVHSPVPQVIVSTSPAVLVPIQGAPVLKPIPGTGLLRIVNTRAAIFAEGPAGPYYLHLLDGWMTSPQPSGPWTQAPIYPAGLDDAAGALAAAGQVDLLNGSPSTPTLELLAAGAPTVYASQTPTELIVFNGQPKLVPIAGTGLQWASNTSADAIVDTADGSWYLLMAGRWYRAAALQGPWSFVASPDLPADFRRIPADSPAGVVLASVAGTPQAREALIASSIPQTAKVPLRGGPTFAPRYDGPPTVGLLPGTDLEYVVNTETPMVRVGGATYYALEAGVWFQSPTLEGPWTLAVSVPAEVYGIPPSSPLHYATYVEIYGSTPEAVYEGYTPGYLGAVATADGVVVYGTGYEYRPWIGEVWYATPETFGLAAQPVYNPALGYAFGFGLGLATAAAAEPYWGGAFYRPYDAGYRCCAVTAANVYSHWGDTVAAGTRAWFAQDGRVGSAAAGTYANLRTGTAGDYWAGRSYDPYTGVAQRGAGRSFDTALGVQGSVARGERYSPATGIVTQGSRTEASGPAGGSVSRDTERAVGPDGGSAAAHQTTVTDPRTGETRSWDTARVGNDLYAGSDGLAYRNTGDGWEQHTSDGWQAAGGDNAWAEQAQQARQASESRLGGVGGGLGDGALGGGASIDGTAGRGLGGVAEGFGGGRFGGGGFGGRFGRR
jgi:hypothetical protein